MRPTITIPVLLALLALSAGCERPISKIPIYSRPSTPQPVETVVVLEAGDATPCPEPDALGRFLRRVVRNDGTVMAPEYDRHEDCLTAALKTFAVTGPRTSRDLFRNDKDELAFWFNARAAWSIRLAMTLFRNGYNTAEKMTAFRFPLAGRQMTLVEIDREIYEIAGPAGVLAAPSASMGRAPLSKTPFEPATIDKAAPRQIDEFMNSRDRFNVDVLERTVKYPPVFWQWRDEFIDRYHYDFGGPKQISLTTALIPYVQPRARRRLQNAIGYVCVEDLAPAKLGVRE